MIFEIAALSFAAITIIAIFFLQSISGKSGGETATDTAVPESDPTSKVDKSQSANGTIGWLGGVNAQTRISCPTCNMKVENSRTTFVSHLINSDICGGAPLSPPESLGISLHEWEELVRDIEIAHPDPSLAGKTSKADGSVQTDSNTNSNSDEVFEFSDDNRAGSPTGNHRDPEIKADGGNDTGSDAISADGGDQSTRKRQAMVEALQELHEDLDRIPLAHEIRDQTEYTQHDFTSEFGSLDEALAVAGYNKREALLDELRRVANKLGRVPSTVDFAEHAEFSSALYTEYFGSWSDTLSAAGLDEGDGDDDGGSKKIKNEAGKNSAVNRNSKNSGEGSKRRQPPDKELLDELRALDEKLDTFPKYGDMNDRGSYSSYTYTERFGSWDDALQEAGINKERKLLEELKRVIEVLGRRPKTSDMAEHSRYSSSMYSNFFGSWSDALDRLNSSELSIEERESRTSITASKRDALIEDLKRLSKEIDGLLKAPDVQQNGEYTIGEYTDAFGSWDEALEKAEIDRKSQILKEVERVWENLGDRPSTTDMNTHGRISSSLVTDYFDSWDEACRRANPDVESAFDAAGSVAQTTKLEETTTTKSNLTDMELHRLHDIVQLQPTKNSDLIEKWDADGGSEVHRYLESHLSEYYYRDHDSYIRATDEAESLIQDSHQGESTNSGGRSNNNEIVDKLKKKRLYGEDK